MNLSVHKSKKQTTVTPVSNTISQLSRNGKYKLLHRTIFPVDISLSKINESELWKDIPDWVINYSERHWQSVIKFSSRTSLNLLNIIQMGSSSLNSFDKTERISDNDNIGVRLGNLVIIFNSEENLRNRCKYSIHDSGEKLIHFITDLEAGQYTVTINDKNKIGLTVNEEDNTAYFETDNITNILSISIIKN